MEIVRIECDHRGLDPKVISAIIKVESSWQTNVARYEKNFIYTYKADVFAEKQNITLHSELTLQRFSWGLMQIMGGTARDNGFDGWLPDLCIPKQGIYWGCEYFERRCSEYLDLKDQIAAYNAGSVRRKSDGSYVNQPYVDKVILSLDSLNDQRIK